MQLITRPNKKGFSVLHIAVAITIIGVLSAVLFPHYKKVIERMRVAEVLVLLGSELSAQERNMLNKHHFTKYWHLLDVAPSQVTPPGTDNDYFNEDRTEFYTRGGYSSFVFPPSYKVYFQEEEGNHWYMVAERIGRGSYVYWFVRPFDSTRVICVPSMEHAASVELCTDFMGVNTPQELPPDPRWMHRR